MACPICVRKEDMKSCHYICEACIPLVRNQDGIDSIEDTFLMTKAEKAKNADANLEEICT